MENNDRFNSITDCNLEHLIDYNDIEINLNKCNFNHCPSLVSILKNKIDQSEILKYASLQSETHLNILDRISSYLNININQIMIINNIYNSINNIFISFATNKSKIVIFISLLKLDLYFILVLKIYYLFLIFDST